MIWCGAAISRALTLALVCRLATAAIPSYIQVCKQSDPNVDQCIINSIENLKPKLLKGIPELNVPPYEPLLIPEIKLSRGPKAAKLEALTRNLSVSGPSQFIIKSLRSDLKKHTFDVDILLPKLSFFGDYDLDIVILALPIRGKGRINGNFTDYKSNIRMRGHLIQKDGEDYLEFEKMKIKLLLGQSQLRLDGLFGGDSVLGEMTNRLVNENSKLFLEEIKPVLEESLASLFTDIANRITLAFTYRELFPE